MGKKPFVQLEKDEHILAFVRVSLWAKWKQIGALFVFVALISLLLFPLLHFQVVGLVMLGILLLWLIFYAWKEWKKWYYSVFIVTDRRVIDVDQYGIFASEELSVSHEDIRDVQAVTKGWINSLLDIGRIRVKTKKRMSYDIAVYGIRRSEDVVSLINDVQLLKSSHLDNQVHVAEKHLQ